MIGETLGSYSVVSKLGAGGMGEVYLAQHTRIDRRAAIKVLLPGLSSNQEVVDRFFSEARSTSSIRHKGIVEVLDCDVHPSGRAYIVMELLEGDSLAGRLAKEPQFGRDLPRVLHVTAAVADAVGAAHAKGIVHRDLKPDNVFLAADPGARFGFVTKILDFGIAKLMTADGDASRPVSARTRTGSLMGTPAYMSPEQCRGASRVDHRTDIYSLGCIVYEMLAGRLPFVYAGFGELISAHLHEAPPALASLGVGAPPTLEAFLQRLLAKSPDHRFATMLDVVTAVRGLEAEPAQLPAAAAAVTQVATPAPNVPTLTTTFSEQASEKLTTPPESPRRWWVAALVGAAAAAGGIALFATRGSSPPPAATAVVARAPSPEIARVTVSVSDAPEGLSVAVDGKPATLPIVFDQGRDTHELTFKAPGFKDRTLRLDATTSRLLTLAMQPEPTQPKLDPPTTPPARPERNETKRRRVRTTDAPALNDDARKL
jgi:eukaryotic-like serine/threonine-protein kinase